MHVTYSRLTLSPLSLIKRRHTFCISTAQRSTLRSTYKTVEGSSIRMLKQFSVHFARRTIRGSMNNNGFVVRGWRESFPFCCFVSVISFRTRILLRACARIKLIYCVAQSQWRIHHFMYRNETRISFVFLCIFFIVMNSRIGRVLCFEIFVVGCARYLAGLINCCWVHELIKYNMNFCGAC